MVIFGKTLYNRAYNLHATCGRSPSHVSRDSYPYIPSSCVSTRWRSEKLLSWVVCPNGIKLAPTLHYWCLLMLRIKNISIFIHESFKRLRVHLIQVILVVIYFHQIHTVSCRWQRKHAVIFHIKR